MRKTKITIKDNDTLKSYGEILDIDKPNNIDLMISTWITLIDTIEYYDINNLCRQLGKKVKQEIFNNTDKTLFNKDYIITAPHIKANRIVPNKPTYIRFEVALKQNGMLLLENGLITLELLKLTNIVEEILNNQTFFTFNKRK